MKKPFLLLFLSLTFLALQAQEPLQQAPLSEDFKQYMNDLKKAGEPQDSRLGYVPPPYRVHFGDLQPAVLTKSAQQLPSSYDLRDEGDVTSVKDQRKFGTCWAFASLGAIESRWKRLEDETVDLSEKNMVTCNGFASEPDDGGNIYMAAAYLSRLQGPLPEDADPYYNLTDTSTCRVHGTPPAYIPQVRFLPENREEVKRAIMNYGAISTSMYVDETMQEAEADMNKYYNPSDFTYYYDGTKSTNHGILIVGWDDNKQVTGGSASPQATKGAWIIKNSWGPNFGEAGYFYIAYEDTQVLTSNGLYPDKEEVENIDSLHYYDKLGMITSLGTGSEVIYGLTRFELLEGESVKKIGTYANSYGTQIEIILFDDFDQQSGRPIQPLDTLANREVLYPGYHTFDMACQAEGELYVQVRYHTPGYEFPMPVEMAIAGYANPSIETSGTNWYSSDGEAWTGVGSDTESNPYDLCIRAYTQKDTPVAAFTSERTYYCMEDTVQFQNTSEGEIDSYNWNFGAGAEPQQATGAGPHLVSYTTAGAKSVSLKVEGPAGQDSIMKKEHLMISEDLHIFFEDTLQETTLGSTLELRVNGYARTYEWEGEGLLSSSKNKAQVSLDGDQEQSTTIRVTGYHGDCSDTDSIKVRFIRGPANDDVCDAMELEAGLTENLTNEYATVQPNEPMPDTTGLNPCNEPMKWCPEGGLQHTVWFTIEPEKEGKLSVITQGMDTQIALYEAATCEDILEPDQHTLLAANDDYFDEEENFAAAIMDLEGLTPGQTYWLQLDGSAGGVTGTFSILVEGTAVGIDNKPSKAEQAATIFPNPSDGNITLRLLHTVQQPAHLEVLTMQGRKIFSRQLSNTSAGTTRQISLPVHAPGVYILRITHAEDTSTQRIIIR